MGRSSRAAIAVAAAVALGAAGLAKAAPAEAAKPWRCAPKDARTVMRTDRLELVFRSDEARERETTWGCLRGVRRRHVVAVQSCDGDVGCGGSPPDLLVRGKYVALSWAGCWTRMACGGSVAVTSLRTGARRGISTPFYVYGTTLTPRGTVVWIDSAEGYAPPKRVMVMTIAGGEAVLDSGTDIDPYSLAVGATRIYWTHGGETRSAPLPG